MLFWPHLCGKLNAQLPLVLRLVLAAVVVAVIVVIAAVVIAIIVVVATAAAAATFHFLKRTQNAYEKFN